MVEIWAEKYRPETIDECVLPERFKTFFKNLVKEESIPNLLLVGRPGMGKTTVAKALCNELGVNFITINGSDETGIDVFRGKIKSFATTISLAVEKPKVVILDEADYLNASSTQPALRNFIEEYSDNCRFIATANYKQKIIDALLSRMTVIDFSFTKEEKVKLITDFYKRVISILKKERVDYDKEVVLKFISSAYPDFRKILVELQRYSFSNDQKIDEGILTAFTDKDFNKLYPILKSGNYTELRRFVARQIQMGVDPNFIIRVLFDMLEPKIESVQGKAMLIALLGKYQAQLPFVADYEIHIMALLSEIILNCKEML